MKLLMFFLFAMICSVVLSNSAKGASISGPLRKSRQIIIVQAKTWDSFEAVLSLHEKKDGEWQTVKQGIPVVLGKKGLGWGRSFDIDYEALDKTAPVKKEGDGKSPSGIFAIQQAFGFSEKAPYVKLPYITLTDRIECVDDGESQHYNRIIDSSAIPLRDRKSSEKMSAIDVYKTGLVIEHNAQPVVKGCGSCIFFHIWEMPDKGTSGCTAMAEDNLSFLLQWLDPAKNPLLLQFTEGMYGNIKERFHLP
ncbi:MAG: L,D-transpeptidase family protein [Proteobacteria bacterium]|nr:L,D-transpeptidase family protein [Pseudomonadota bacterium]